MIRRVEPVILCLVLLLSKSGVQESMATQASRVNDDMGQLIFVERFEDGDALRNWWVEGGQAVWIENGRLHLRADPERGKGARGNCVTVWCKQRFEGDLRIEFDARVLNSYEQANQIAAFFHYSHPDPEKTLYETRYRRADAAYGKYFDMNGYIMTFVRDRRFDAGKTEDGRAKARFRMRRNPGFNKIAQHYDPMGVRLHHTYHVSLTFKDGVLTTSVDGKQYLHAEDDNPHAGGLFALRTFGTYQWVDNIEVYSLDEQDGNQQRNNQDEQQPHNE